MHSNREFTKYTVSVDTNYIRIFVNITTSPFSTEQVLYGQVLSYTYFNALFIFEDFGLLYYRI